MSKAFKLSSLALALVAATGMAGLAQAGAAEDDGQAVQSASAEDAEGRAIFEANCSSCHEIGDATSRAKDLAGWTETIAKMVSYGAPVAVEDQQRIAAYLAATYPAPAQ
jgi:cytochrome c5